MNCQICNTAVNPDDLYCPQCYATVTLAVKGRVDVPADVAARASNFAGRAWVVDQIVDWMNRGSERFFLLTGEPGSGKTALAAWLAGVGSTPDAAAARDALERVRDSWKAAHFCVAEDQRGSLNPGRFVQSISSQLSDRYGDFAQAILQRNVQIIINQQVRENFGKVVGAQIGTLIINSNFEDTYDRALREPLKQIYHYSQFSGLRIFILVDALDEALTFGYPNIVTLLAGSDDFPDGVRFLLTSRNDPNVTKKFKSVRHLDLSSDKYKRDSDDDIFVYVKRRLSEEKIKSHIARVSAADDIEETLVNQAAGNFLYVRFLLDEVADNKRSLAELSGLPRGLYGMYRMYLDRIMLQGSQGNPGQRWLNQFQPLIGCLSVALPAAPLESLHHWMREDDSHINVRLSEVQQITEYDPGYEGGYKLYHRSMAEFLAARDFRENGTPEINSYYTPPAEQHKCIAQYYLTQFNGDWRACDRYGLRQLVSHLRALIDLDQAGDGRKKWARAIYSVVLNESFRAAQRAKPGGLHGTLSDLHTALRVALAADELIPALACIGAYRDTVRSGSMATDIFRAVNSGEFERARLLAEHYGLALKIRGTWAQVLELYLAWEAAEAGDEVNVLKAVSATEDLPLAQTEKLCDALLTRIARTLAGKPGSQSNVQDWLVRLSAGRDAESLLNSYGPARPLTPDEKRQLLAKKSELMAEMEKAATELQAEYSVGHPQPFFDAEIAAFNAERLGSLLTSLAADPIGRDDIDQVLGPVLINPYPQYRDLAITALGVAVLAVPDASWVRLRLQRILQTTLDSEGATFTFDLPSVLLAEAERRQIPAQDLSNYLNKARTHEDLWGTRVRAYSAHASALFRQGLSAEAFAEMENATRLLGGFAGYATLHLISLINRWCEFGQPQWACEPVVSWGHDLLTEAMKRAEHVAEPNFRDQRIDLVNRYGEWLKIATPDLETILSTLVNTSDPDVRKAYNDFVSARWSWPADKPNWEALKALIPAVLTDGTTLDAVLGRVFGLRIRQFSNEEIVEVIRICSASLTTARPWELGEIVAV
jgi:hypothetical protein